jgi:hypothetical protein
MNVFYNTLYSSRTKFNFVVCLIKAFQFDSKGF